VRPSLQNPHSTPTAAMRQREHKQWNKFTSKKIAMKAKNHKHLFIGMVLLFSFCSCTNQYERQAEGYYEVGSYEAKDSLSKAKIDLPSSLTLKDDKTFLLVFKDSTSKGKWTADDYGDWTLVEFFINDNKIQTQLGINQIRAINPSDFNCPQLKSLVFRKVVKK